MNGGVMSWPYKQGRRKWRSRAAKHKTKVRARVRLFPPVITFPRLNAVVRTE